MDDYCKHELKETTHYGKIGSGEETVQCLDCGQLLKDTREEPITGWGSPRREEE